MSRKWLKYLLWKISSENIFLGKSFGYCRRPETASKKYRLKNIFIAQIFAVIFSMFPQIHDFYPSKKIEKSFYPPSSCLI